MHQWLLNRLIRFLDFFHFAVQYFLFVLYPPSYHAVLHPIFYYPIAVLFIIVSCSEFGTHIVIVLYVNLLC